MASGPPNLYLIGAVALTSPMGLNPQDAVEEFGGDFAVKPVVGAQQPREFVGPADVLLTLSGETFPFFFAQAGGNDGQRDLATLKGYAAAGQPVPVSRGDGANMGFYVLQKGQVKHSNLSRYGTGRKQDFVLQLVQVPNGPTSAVAAGLFTGLITLLGQAG